MDASTANTMLHFAIIPIENVVACNYILGKVLEAINESTSMFPENLGEIYCVRQLGLNAINTYALWPLVVQKKSPIHNDLTKLNQSAIKWLLHSHFSVSFDKDRKDFKKYLTPLQGFSASGLIPTLKGAIAARSVIFLEQKMANTYQQECHRRNNLCNEGYQRMESYDKFLMTLAWMRDDPLKRMFSKEFKGIYSEHMEEDQDGLFFDHISLVDNESVANVCTPPTTRATSPALTERPDDNANDDSAEKKSILPPTLKYIAVIETDTDKAFFKLDILDINQKKREIMNKAKDMCTEMVSMGYGGKVKLQDIMDMAVKMTKK